MNNANSGSLAGYSVEIDQIERPPWDEALQLFADASIHQTWAAGEVMKGRENLSHLVLRSGSDILAMCQITVKRMPLLNGGVADAFSGPLWRRKGEDAHLDRFSLMIRALKDEYASHRGCILRVWPNEFRDDRNECAAVLRSLGFLENASAPLRRTLLLDLEPPLDVLRRNLGNTWRLHLNRSEKSALSVVEGTEDGLYQIFLTHLREMIARKQFVPQVHYDKFRAIQNELPDDLKMRIMVAFLDGKPVSSIVCSAVGDSAVYLFGATANDGLKTHASNLLHWRMIQSLKANGNTRYDLGGIAPEHNPGTYQYKRGLGGKLAHDRTRLGEFVYARDFRSRLFLAGIKRLTPIRDLAFRMHRRLFT
jgi:hypothetical protein